MMPRPKKATPQTPTHPLLAIIRELESAPDLLELAQREGHGLAPKVLANLTRAVALPPEQVKQWLAGLATRTGLDANTTGWLSDNPDQLRHALATTLSYITGLLGPLPTQVPAMVRRQRAKDTPRATQAKQKAAQARVEGTQQKAEQIRDAWHANLAKPVSHQQTKQAFASLLANKHDLPTREVLAILKTEPAKPRRKTPIKGKRPKR